MQTAMAVNTAHALMRGRVARSFKAHLRQGGHLLDKTGTLTSDKPWHRHRLSQADGEGGYRPHGVSRGDQVRVVGRATALQIDGKRLHPLAGGDDASSGGRSQDPDGASTETSGSRAQTGAGRGAKRAERHQSFLEAASAAGAQPNPPSERGRDPSVKILLRNHFSSALQRMSTVAQVQETSGEAPPTGFSPRAPRDGRHLLARSPRVLPPTTGCPGGLRIIAPAHRPHPRELLASRIIATP